MSSLTRTGRLNRGRTVLQLLALAAMIAQVAGCAPKVQDTESFNFRDQFAGVLEDRGSLTYAAQSWAADGTPETSETVTGTIVLRNAADMRPLGHSFYDDGFGNLVRFGSFSAPELGGKGQWSLSFLNDGALQLAIDFRNDRLVDVLVELLPDGRLGSLGDPDMMWLLECLSGQLLGGSNMADAASHCLGGVSSGGGGFGGGLSDDVDRLRDPDCSGDSGSQPGSTARDYWEPQSTISTETENGDTVTASGWESPEGDTAWEITVTNSDGEVVYHEVGTRNAAGDEVSQEITVIDIDPATGNTVTTTRTRENDEEWTVSIGPIEVDDTSGGGSGPSPTNQPDPACDDCPVSDPRCAAAPNDIASLWDCHASTGMSLSECLTRMRDAVYVATGGRCHTAAGAAGGTTIACPDLELMNCLESGGSIAECLRANEGYGGGDDIGPNEGDWLSDRLGRSRGVAGAYIDSTPMGAVFITLCNEGVEQLCRGLGRF